MSAGIEIPLSHVAAVGDAKVLAQDAALLLVTAPMRSQHGAAISAMPFADDPQSVTVRLKVESGQLAIGWRSPRAADWAARTVVARTVGAIDIALRIPDEAVGGQLVFDNGADGDRPAVAFIERIEATRRDYAADSARAADLLHTRDGDGLEPNGEALNFLERHAKRLGREDFLSLAPAPSAIRQNLATSIWEYAHAKTELTSYPWSITLPVADLCNARCTFCTSWLDGRKVLDLDTLDMFEPVLRHALCIGLVGHGEPLAHPRFDELCERLDRLRDPLSLVYTITNGFFLDKWREQLDRMNLYAYSVSLNAATAETHDAVMGLGGDAFPRIVDAIAHRVEAGKRSPRPGNVYITMVVTRQNIAEIPAFIELGNRLGVTEVRLRSLLPQGSLLPGLNYHELPPYLHPEFEELRRSAIDAIRGSHVRVEADPAVWGQPVFPELLQQQIAERPPPHVGRDEAQRDRELRQRNEFLYHQEKGAFRGRALESGSEVRWVDGVLRVATPQGSGAYAAELPIAGDGGEHRVEVEVKVHCDAGVLGLGLLDEAQNLWLDRVFVGPGPEAAVRLKAAGGEQDVRLVIHNGADGIASRGWVGGGEVRLGVEPPQPLAWHLLKVHNAADPLDDGTNPLGRAPRFACKAVYYNLYINEFFYRMNPCCYMQQVPGFEEVRLDGGITFMEGWNSPGMIELRRRLAEGPLFGACMRCPEKW